MITAFMIGNPVSAAAQAQPAAGHKAPAQAAAGVDIPIPDIRYTKFVLGNGLTVLVHEDHKAPIVAVNTWYHVGSKNEKLGKTGFAHLFEHLMFSGSDDFNHTYINAMEKIGATNLNGTTNNDRTNYFENVPTSMLDYALFAESDRMGHLARRTRPEEARPATRRGAKRKAPGREPALRRYGTIDRREHLSGRPSLFVDGDRLDERSGRSLAE